eukprot:COSAG06_NODE_397_length_16244_cov_230.792320_16_plen_322_part_00
MASLRTLVFFNIGQQYTLPSGYTYQGNNLWLGNTRVYGPVSALRALPGLRNHWSGFTACKSYSSVCNHGLVSDPLQMAGTDECACCVGAVADRNEATGACVSVEPQAAATLSNKQDWLVTLVIVIVIFGTGIRLNARRSAVTIPRANAPRPDAINPPGRWDAMISYTQRNPQAELLAEALHSSMEKQLGDHTVWLDIKMDKLHEAAMQEAAQNSHCIIAIVTGPHTRDDPAHGEKPEDNAYFMREYCVKELRWARKIGVPIQPVILADDKKRIHELLALAPEDLHDLGRTDFIHLDRSRPAFWQTSVDEVLKNIADLHSGT